MAKRVTDLPELPIADGNDLIPLVDVSGNVTKRVTPAGLAQAIAANLPAGSVGPAARGGGVKIGVIPGSTFGSAGSKIITGLGFKPKRVRFSLVPIDSSTSHRIAWGAMTPTDQFCYTSAAGSTGFSQRTWFGAANTGKVAIGWINAGNTSPQMAAGYVSMDDDGFTINVLVANSTFDVVYEADA